MENRVPTKPGRIKLTDDSGNVTYYYMERADEPTVEGTPLNKATLFSVTNEELYQCSVPSEAFDKLAESIEIYLPLDGWSAERDENGYLYQQVEAEKINSKMNPLASLKGSLRNEKASWPFIHAIETYDGYVIARAVNLPYTDITVELKGV